MAQLIFPFALGLFLVLVQPVVDMVCELALRKNRFGERAIRAAGWTGATAGFLPAAVLTTYGALLVMWDEGHEDGDGILIGAVILLLACFVLFLLTIARSGPDQAWRVGPEKFSYTFLQVVLAVLNVIGIGLVIWYHFQGTPAESTST